MLPRIMNDVPIQEQAQEGEDLLLRLVEGKSAFLRKVQARCSFSVSVPEMKKLGRM